MKFKLSQFSTRITDTPDKGQHLLYNTRTRGLVGIDDNGWRLLCELPAIPSDAQRKSWLSALAKRGFIVPQELDEGESYVQRLERAKGNTDRLHVTLSLIQGCNFGCGYCYQGGNQSTHDGSKITEDGTDGSIQTDEIRTFLKGQCEDRAVKRLFFTAYGGEPLLNKPALIDIAKSMQAYCHQNDIQWMFDMVSNGSLLTRKTVVELKQLGFCQVQITIDGNRETHNQSRPWLNPNDNPKAREIGTYDIIMGNLQRWAGLIHTNVLCVVSESNLPAAHELIDTLANLGLAEKRVRMIFSPISPTYDSETVSQTAQNFADNPDLLKAELKVIDAITQLQIHAAERGLIDDLRPKATWCSVIRANGENITITPDGKIYSCALFIGRDDEHSTGHIRNNDRGGMDARMQAFKYPDPCLRCEYLPICANCRADALSTTGDLLGANSQKERFERIVPKLIKAHYTQQHAQVTISR
jgi:uncharacterized protein